MWQLGIAYDKFIRGTDDHHEVLVAEFLSNFLADEFLRTDLI